jgi:hypothetical protein
MKFECKHLSSSLVGAFAFFLSTAATLAVTSTSVNAISITNRDDKDHKVTVIEGEAKTDHALKATAVVENICMKGCVVRLNDSENDEYELEGTEVVSIEDGYLYYDGPDAPAENMPAPAPGAPAPAVPPKL